VKGVALDSPFALLPSVLTIVMNPDAEADLVRELNPLNRPSREKRSCAFYSNSIYKSVTDYDGNLCIRRSKIFSGGNFVICAHFTDSSI
jgi:hypothetical protein